MDLVNCFINSYRNYRLKGFNVGRAYRSAVSKVNVELINWSCINEKAITAQQISLVNSFHDEKFLRLVEDTHDLTDKERDIYFNRSRLQLVK